MKKILEEKRLFGINAYALKLLAIVTMTIDHVQKVLPRVEYPLWLNAVGRISFPLFAFLLAEGAVHTKSFWRYLMRLLVVGIVAEPIYDFAFSNTYFNWGAQNVLFTLAAALCAVQLFRYFKSKKKPVPAILLPVVIAAAAQLLHFSYGCSGVLCVMFFAVANEQSNRWYALGLDVLAILATLGSTTNHALQIFALAALPFILLYNGKTGKRLGVVCYVYYPLHLVILLFIGLVMAGVMM